MSCEGIVVPGIFVEGHRCAVGAVDAVRKNPLGIYVHAFNWSQDVTAGEPK